MGACWRLPVVAGLWVVMVLVFAVCLVIWLGLLMRWGSVLGILGV